MANLWQTFTAAPHRVMFLGGVLQLVVAVGWWSVELAARYAGVGAPFVSPIYTTWAHAWLMLFGLFPFFMFGFLMTTYPRWMAVQPVPRRDYLGAFLLLSAGAGVFYAGLSVGMAALVSGLLLHAAGLGWGAYALLRVYRNAGAKSSRRYETHLNFALLFGLAAELMFVGWALSGDGRLLQAALAAALWLFLIPVLVLVGHRMIPFFSSAVLPGYRLVQPGWSFPLLWGAVAMHFGMVAAGTHAWLWLPDSGLLFLAVHHMAHWQPRRALAVPLLGALHLAFGLLSIGLLLSVVQSLWLLATGEWLWLRAPLHAIGIGFIAGMTIAMVTRVSRGHSGRPLEMGRLDMFAFAAILLAAVARVAAELTPAAAPLSLVAALLWLVGVMPWAARWIPVYLQPRADGKPD